MIVVNNHRFWTLDDRIEANGATVQQVDANGEQVYPSTFQFNVQRRCFWEFRTCTVRGANVRANQVGCELRGYTTRPIYRASMGDCSPCWRSLLFYVDVTLVGLKGGGGDGLTVTPYYALNGTIVYRFASKSLGLLTKDVLNKRFRTLMGAGTSLEAYGYDLSHLEGKVALSAQCQAVATVDASGNDLEFFGTRYNYGSEEMVWANDLGEYVCAGHGIAWVDGLEMPG